MKRHCDGWSAGFREEGGSYSASQSDEGRVFVGLYRWGCWLSMGSSDWQWRGSRRGQWDSSGPFRKVSDQGSRFSLVVSIPLHICQLWTQGAAEKTAVTERSVWEDIRIQVTSEKSFISKSKSNKYYHLQSLVAPLTACLLKNVLCYNTYSIWFSISKSCNWPHCQCHTTERSTCRDQIQIEPEKEYMTQIPPPSKNRELCTFTPMSALLIVVRVSE